MNNPLLIFDILHDTLISKWDFYRISLIGILGYLDTVLPHWIYIAYYIVLLGVSLTDFNKIYQLSIYQRALILFLTIGIFLATIFAMFILDAQESGSSLVAEGIQGRYFIPPLVVILFAIYGIFPFKNSFLGSNKFISMVLFVFCFVILYQTEHTLYLRYFKVGNDYFKFING
jgi:hypothetical protein